MKQTSGRETQLLEWSSLYKKHMVASKVYFRQSLGEESPCSTRSIVIVSALNYANMKSMCGPVQKS